jgi:hypothetical protein
MQATMEQIRPTRKSPLLSSAASTVISPAATGCGRQLQLPPLTCSSSDNEREAHVRNRHEQIRLNKLLDHIDVQERVYVQLFNKERHVVEATLTHVASTSSLSSAAAVARCRQHRQQQRAQLQCQPQQRLRCLASVMPAIPAGGGIASFHATAAARRSVSIDRTQSHSSPTIVDLVNDDDGGDTCFEFGKISREDDSCSSCQAAKDDGMSASCRYVA